MNALFTEWKKIARELSRAWSGLIVVVVIAVVSRVLHDVIPNAMLTKAISEILIALLLGLLIRNTMQLPAQIDAGAKFALNRILRCGIILLGLRLSVQDVAATGATALALIIFCIAFALGLAFLVGRVLKVSRKLTALIGIGTAICGNSAIVATAPLIEAKEEDLSFAVAMITFFGLIAVIVYPIIGHTLALSDATFGLWSGTAVNDTSQVVATAASFSHRALDIAAIVKLTRNVFLGPVMIMMGLIYAQATHHAAQKKVSMRPVIPWFVIAFFAMSLLRTIGISAGVLPQSVDKPEHLFVSAAWLKLADDVSKFAILCALTGIGLSTNIASLRKVGWKPFILALIVVSALAVTSLAVILVSGLGG